MRSNDPVVRVVHLLKVCQQGHGCLQTRKLGAGDWGEAGVVDGGDDGVFGDAVGERLGFKGPDAAAEGGLAVVGGDGVPCYEERGGG